VVENDALIDGIGRAQGLAFSGDQDGARALYQGLWTEATRAEDNYQACVAAHFMAHAQVEPEAQLDWHLRALRAAEAVDDGRVRAFYPSLYANVADVYLRLSNLTRAREHIDKARATAHVLPDDHYGRMIRSLIERVSQTIERDGSPDGQAGPDGPVI